MDFWVGHAQQPVNIPDSSWTTAAVKLCQSQLDHPLAHAPTTKLQVRVTGSSLKDDFTGAVERVIFKPEPDLPVQQIFCIILSPLQPPTFCAACF